MIWRTRYQDHLIELPGLPPLEARRLDGRDSITFPIPGITLGAFSNRGSTELAMWRKLIASVSEEAPACLWLRADREFVASATPDSVTERTYLCEGDPWSEILGRQEGEESFAILAKPSRYLVFLGLPTEDGLDRVSDFLRAD